MAMILIINSIDMCLDRTEGRGHNPVTLVVVENIKGENQTAEYKMFSVSAGHEAEANA